MDRRNDATFARRGTSGGRWPSPTWAMLSGCGLWGLSWWPLQRFAAQGLGAAALAATCYAALTLAALPVLWRQRRECAQQPRRALAIMACGGWANAAFTCALAIGDVTRAMLLMYLLPVWSVLAGRVLLGEAMAPRRLVAVGLALLGALLALGTGSTSAFGLADFLALSSGVAVALNNVALRSAERLPQGSKNALVFAGGLLSALAAAMLLGQSAPSLPQLGPVLLYAFAWLGVANVAVQYGVSFMQAGRAGVLLAFELVIAIGSAAALGASELGLRQCIGAGLIVLATVLEARAARDKPR